MSISVPLEELAAELAERGAGYVLTSNAGSRPHIMHVHFVTDGTELRAEVGRSAVANIRAEPAVALLWPPTADDEYSLIVDGTAIIEGEATAVITAVGAIRHRPAPPPSPTTAG
jgi:hypothetical protein